MSRKNVLLLLFVMALVSATILLYYKLNRANAIVAALTATVDSYKPASGHEHSDIRQWMIRQELSRTGPIIIVGDSITEAAPLPKSICGRTVVNAGIGGATVKFLLDASPSLFSGTSPALVIIAIGTNDAHPAQDRVPMFGALYAKLLTEVGKISPRVAITTIPLIEPNGDVSRGGGFDIDLVPKLNEEITKLAMTARVDLIDVSAAIAQANLKIATIDGVHLSQGAYDAWLKAVRNGIMKSLPCSSTD